MIDKKLKMKVSLF